MAIQKEIWINSIVQPFRAPYSFLLLSVDHSDSIEGRIVHVPNAGAGAKIHKNTSELPLKVGQREDVDLTYKIDSYKISPILIPGAEEIELSYNKRESILSDSRAKLYEEVAADTMAKWVAGVKKPLSKSTPGGVKGWLKAIATKFATHKVPQADRYVMFKSDTYYQFLDTLSQSEHLAFSACADISKGILGEYLGFKIVSEFYLPEGVELFAWHKDSVSRAMDKLSIYEDEDDPTYYGDVISGELRAGGAVIRNDSRGVAAVNATGDKVDAPADTSEGLNAMEPTDE